MRPALGIRAVREALNSGATASRLLRSTLGLCHVRAAAPPAFTAFIGAIFRLRNPFVPVFPHRVWRARTPVESLRIDKHMMMVPTYTEDI